MMRRGRRSAFGLLGRLVLAAALGVVLRGTVGAAEDEAFVGVKDGYPQPPGDMSTETYTAFWKAFVRSVLMILATEIADKTFFIAAIMAMSHPRIVVFGGAVGALAVMTVLSAALGSALPSLLSTSYTHFASALLFLYFGLRMLKEGLDSRGGPSEELTEVEEELTKKREAGSKKTSEGYDLEGGSSSSGTSRVTAKKLSSEVAMMSFTMTFLAEWGDRSQIATIALATTKDMWGVSVGGIIGHSLCTGMAVIGGRMLAARISEKTVHLVGGALFILFGLHALMVSD